MSTREKTITEFMIEEQRRYPDATGDFTALLNDVRLACKRISFIVGRGGARGKDFNMRWIASLVAEVHRILIRGGLYMYPKDTKDPSKPGRLRLLYEANPMTMIRVWTNTTAHRCSKSALCFCKTNDESAQAV